MKFGKYASDRQNHLISKIYEHGIEKKSNGEIFPPGFLTGYVRRREMGTGFNSTKVQRPVTRVALQVQGPVMMLCKRRLAMVSTSVGLYLLY